MDRVNRSFLVVATLIAIPTAFAMTTLTSGEAPYVSQAIALESDESSTIQQVVGKQVNTTKTRPGLLQVLSGSRSEGDRDIGDGCCGHVLQDDGRFNGQEVKAAAGVLGAPDVDGGHSGCRVKGY